MKNKCTFLLTALFLLISMPYAEAGTKDYCNTLVNTGGVNYYLSFEKVGGKYQATINVEGNHKLYMYPYSKPSGYESHTGEGTATIVITYSSKPNSTGFNAVCLDGTSSQVNFYFYSHENKEINWENSCGPVLAITSATLASKTSSEIVLNVTSTEATKYKVVCSQFTRELTVSSGTAASGQITLSGLSASTTYNLTVYAMDGNGNTSSSGISLSVTTNAPPAETTPPTIGDLTYALTGNGYSTVNITVKATDNIGITRVVIKNGSTGLLDQNVASTTSLNQIFAVSGLPIGATTTLTVTVYDAAGNNSSQTIDVTTNAPNPQMTSAALASTTQNSVTLNVASTGGNGYKVTYGGNTITTTATNGQITITGLNSGTTYNFTVYAMYDTYECSNPITIKAKTVEVGCSGTSTTCTSGGSEFVSYKINYIGGNILFTVKSTTANQLTSCKLNYATNTSGANAVSGLPMTITDGEATYTLPATGNIASGTLYFSFTYKTGGMGSEGSTTSGWYSAFQYPIGGCALDDDMPYMQSVSKASATKNSITLNVTGVVYIDGIETPTTQYEVTYGSTTQTLTATDGKITINDLEHSTSYTFVVKAVYGSNTSENLKTIATTTMKASQCSGIRGHFAYTPEQQAANPRINYEIGYANDVITMTFTDEDGLNLDFIEIHWNIPGKAGGSVNHTNGVTLTGSTATYVLNVTDDTWIGCAMGISVLYSNTQEGGNLQTSTTNNPDADDNNVIYYVVGECGTADTEDPVITNAFVSSTGNTTADIHIVATDDTGLTQVQIKDNNANTILTETIKRLTTLDATYTITGLTKNTTYSGYTVTVIDRADKAVTVTLPNFTTTNTPEPTILSAAVTGEPKSSSIVLAVTSEQANQYKVVEKDGKFADKILTLTSGTADNGQITITGLKGRTEYTVYVYAMYDNTVSVNNKTVTFTTPVGSECSGTRGSHTGNMANAFDFLIDFDGTNLIFEFTSKIDFDYLQLEWTNKDGSFTHNITSNNGITINGSDKKTATYTYNVPDNRIGEAIGIRIIYSNTDMPGNEQTSSDVSIDDPNIIYYKIGDCGCEEDDGNNPVLDDVSLAYSTPNSAVLNVRATDASSTVETYVVEVKQGGNILKTRDYYATDGQITISGLNSCATYSFKVWAKDPSCRVSANYKEVTAAKTTMNHATPENGAKAVFVWDENVWNKGEKTIDGDLNSRGGSQHKEVENLETALENAILTITLGEEAKVINEIDIYWERACATDYELQASMDSITWSTIVRYTNMPKWTMDGESRTRGKDNMVHRFYEMPAKFLRVKPNMLYVAAQWGMSIYEFEAYGPCEAPNIVCPVVLDVHSIATKAQSAVLSVSAIDQQTYDPSELTYIITTKTEVPGRREITNTYTFAPGDEKRSELNGKTNITIDGLIPGTFYTIIVQAKDPHGNLSCNENSIEIRTGKADGCGLIREGSDANVDGSWVAYPSGMSYRLELVNNDEGTEFTTNLTFKGVPDGMTINTAYLAVEKVASEEDGYAGWVEVPMTRNDEIGGFTITLNESSTYTRNRVSEEEPEGTYEFQLFNNWPQIEVSFKLETSEGIIHSNNFTYNAAEKICEEYFIIFHEGSEPADDMTTYYTGSTIPHEIFYYRLLNPGEWTPLCLPFDVDKVSIYDPEDRQYYDIVATTSTQVGNYYLRRQTENVSGENFQNGWYDGNDQLPQKNVPYNFGVPTTGDYYKDKYIIFHGAANQTISTEFELGTPSIGDDQYTLYGNNTLMPQTITKAYKEDDDGAYYRLYDEWSLKPFECYVLASQNTMRHMPVIRKWTHPNDATTIEDTSSDQPVEEIHIYTLLGQSIGTLHQCTIQEAKTYLLQHMNPGCYIISTPNTVAKLLIQ